MAELIFKLHQVPDDEANDIRDLLTEHGIPFYETSAGTWGISLAAIWVHEKDHAQVGKQLIADYQRERYARVLQQRATETAQQTHSSWLDHWRQRPIKISAYIALIGIITYFSIRPFLMIGV